MRRPILINKIAAIRSKNAAVLDVPSTIAMMLKIRDTTADNSPATINKISIFFLDLIVITNSRWVRNPTAILAS